MATASRKPYLSSGYLALALKMQEAASAMSFDDIQRRLSDTLNDLYRGTGTYAYLITVFGDSKSGFCIYSCDGDLHKAAYTCSSTGATIDTANAKDVVPLTTYEEEVADVTEAGRRNSTRDLKQLQSIHDASMALGATCGMKESASGSAASLNLTESASTIERILLKEAKSDYEIKLISPGKGSSAFYPAEVLRRDGPEVFGAGTHVYLNHPTAAEEAQRPEGDVANLAGVLTTGAVYHESHPKGEGLYARMKVFADHASAVEEKAAYVGMSIRASGIAEAGGKMRDGVPVLKKLTAAQSVDVVTRAGAGGMILTEAAKPQNSQEVSMTETEVTKLVESAVAAAVAKAVETTVAKTAGTVQSLTERAIRGDAREEGARLLESVSLPASSKARVIETCLRDLPIKEGALDSAKFIDLICAEAKREGSYVAGLVGAGRVTGLGASSAVIIDPAAAEARRVAEAAASERELKESAATFERLGMSASAALIAARGRAF